MDKKISAMPVATSVGATDLIPIVQGGVNKVVTAGSLTSSSSNLTTAGILKLEPFVQVDDNSVINTTKSFVVITGTHVLPNGTDGQIMIFSTETGATLDFNASTFVFSPSATMMVIYSTAIGQWLIISSQGVTS